MPPKAPLKIAKKKVKHADKKKRMIEEEASENLEDDNDLLNMDQNNAMGGIDQEQLTQEEKEE